MKSALPRMAAGIICTPHGMRKEDSLSMKEHP